MVSELYVIYSDLYMCGKRLDVNWEGHRVGLGQFSSRVAQRFPSVIATGRNLARSAYLYHK